MNYPLIDEYMTYDYNSHRYVLEPKYIYDKYKVILSNVLLSEELVKPFMDLISVQVYGFIHKHNINTALQDYLIAKTKSGRRIIKEAMEQQFLYVASVGDVTRMLEEARRIHWVDISAENILNEIMPEIGSSILYTGNLNFYCSPSDNTEW